MYLECPAAGRARLPPNPFDVLGVKRGTEKSEVRKLFRSSEASLHLSAVLNAVHLAWIEAKSSQKLGCESFFIHFSSFFNG